MGYCTNRPPGWEPPNPEDKACEHGLTGPCTKCHVGCDRCEGLGFLQNAYCDASEEQAMEAEGKFTPELGDSLCPGPEDDPESDAAQLWADLSYLSALRWRPFMKDDWFAFAGAGLDAHICYNEDKLYVRSVEEGVMIIEEYEVDHPSVAADYSRTWTFKVL